VPIWLLPEDGSDGIIDEGPGSYGEKEILRRSFLEEMGRSSDGQEWLNAYEMGRDLRKLMYRLDCGASTWEQKSFKLWVKDRFDWAQRHVGACPNTNEYHAEFLG
jgi:hypothetical protein